MLKDKTVLRRLHMPPTVPAHSPQTKTLKEKIEHFNRKKAKSNDLAIKQKINTEFYQALAQFDEEHAQSERQQNQSESEEEVFKSFCLMELRQRLDKVWGSSWAALDYLIINEELHIYLITPNCVKKYCHPFGAKEKQILRFFHQPNRNQKHYQQLADLLLPNRLENHLNPKTVLLIAPDGPLFQIPWLGLLQREEFLIERCIPLITPSLHIWLFLAERVDQKRGVDLKKGAFFGLSHFENDDLVALTHTGGELETLHKLFGDRLVAKTDERATREAFFDTLENNRFQFLHLATHGRFHPDFNGRGKRFGPLRWASVVR